MLRLFSSVRKTLINEGKTSRYVRYALGEVLLIMVGIILALQFNNWNEGRKLEQERRELIEGLIADFQTNRDRAKESRSQAVNVMSEMATTMESVMANDPSITQENLDSFHEAKYLGLQYRPLLGRYHSAVSNGSIDLLDEPSLIELLIEFSEENGRFQIVWNFAMEYAFQGELPALRRSVGSLPGGAGPWTDSLPKFSGFEMSFEESLEWMKREEVYASHENMLLMKAYREDILTNLMALADKTLTALEELD